MQHEGQRIDDIMKGTPTGTEALVCQDITGRQQHGLNKYGVSVADNKLTTRQWVQHQYEESLDHAVYSKRLKGELDELAESYAGCSDFLTFGFESFNLNPFEKEALNKLIEGLKKL